MLERIGSVEADPHILILQRLDERRDGLLGHRAHIRQCLGSDGAKPVIFAPLQGFHERRDGFLYLRAYLPQRLGSIRADIAFFVTQSEDIHVELLNRRANKGAALEAVARRLGDRSPPDPPDRLTLRSAS